MIELLLVRADVNPTWGVCEKCRNHPPLDFGRICKYQDCGGDIIPAPTSEGRETISYCSSITLSEEEAKGLKGYWAKCAFPFVFPQDKGVADKLLRDDGSLHLPGWNTPQIPPDQYPTLEIKGTDA